MNINESYNNTLLNYTTTINQSYSSIVLLTSIPIPIMLNKIEAES